MSAARGVDTITWENQQQKNLSKTWDLFMPIRNTAWLTLRPVHIFHIIRFCKVAAWRWGPHPLETSGKETSLWSPSPLADHHHNKVWNNRDRCHACQNQIPLWVCRMQSDKPVEKCPLKKSITDYTQFGTTHVWFIFSLSFHNFPTEIL